MHMSQAERAPKQEEPQKAEDSSKFEKGGEKRKEWLQEEREAVKGDLARVKNEGLPLFRALKELEKSAGENSDAETKIKIERLRSGIEEARVKFEALKEELKEVEAERANLILDEIIINLSNKSGRGDGMRQVEFLVDDLDESEMRDKAREVVGEAGERALEIFRSELGELRKNKGDSTIFDVAGFKEMGNLVRRMQKFDPRLADEYNTLILKECATLGKGNSPEGFRKKTFFPLDNDVIYAALNDVNSRLAAGEQLPDSVETALAEALPYLRASDTVDTNNNSRFLSDVFLGRSQDVATPEVNKKISALDRKSYLTRVRAAHEQVETRYKQAA